MDCVRFLFVFPLLWVWCCNPKSENKDQGYLYFEHPSMGSMFSVTVYSNDSADVAQTVNKAFVLLDSLNLIMSDYLPHSELMRLSQSSGLDQYVKVSTELDDILRLSSYWYEWSEGIFDVTVGSYTQLWRRAQRQDLLPSKEISKASSSVGFNLVHMDSLKGVLLEEENMQLDLGGIAKGYAVDMIYNLLADHGYSISLIDGGGDLRIGDPPPDKDSWEVAVETYLGRDTILNLSNVGVATSGDFYRSIEIDGKRYSHIIDPFTGYGVMASRVVTAISIDCTTADVLASIYSITGPNNARLNSKIDTMSNVLIYEKEQGGTLFYEISGNKKSVK